MSPFASLRSITASPRLAVAVIGALALTTMVACDNRGGGGTARCPTTCSSVQMCCPTATGNACVDYFTNAAHCGGCGNVCASGQICVGGMCMTTSTFPDASVDARTVGTDAPIPSACSPACGADFQCCGSTCVARDGAGGTSDPSFSNCGACGRACTASTANRCGRFGTMTTCMCGSGPACDARLGETCALGTSGDYECLRTDIPENCGSPPVRCNTGESCEGGRCVCGSTGAACPAGQTCVSSGGTSSCRNLSSDPMNCGMVGNVCAPGETCSGGRCLCPGAGGAMTECMDAGGGIIPGMGGGTPSCGESGGFSLPCGGGGGLPIGGSCGEVCCPGTGCVPVDNNNCGACGMTCAAGTECGTSLIGGGDGGLPF
ncbi:MAG: hypothetical protein OHK0013_45210 [Sandaracinaceae bacterium]